MFYFFMDWLRDSLQQGVRRIVGTKKLTYITTNDLDADGKLKPGYLADRRKEKKRRRESGEDAF